MKSIAAALIILASFMAFDLPATSSCFAPSFLAALNESSGVVAATPIAISVKEVAANKRQTILWEVDESWKGRHFKRSTLSTRNTWIVPVVKGEPWLLFLTGKEPYLLKPSPCARSQPLQHALSDVRDLYKWLEKQRVGA